MGDDTEKMELEPEFESENSPEETSQPVPKKHPHKIILAAVTAGVIVVALGVGSSLALMPAKSDSENLSPAASSSAVASSSSANASSSAAASSSSSAASSNAAASADPADKTQVESSEAGTQAAPAGTSSTPAGGGSTTPAAQPTHVHSWEPITAEVQVGEEPIYDYQYVVVVSDGSVFSTTNEALHYIESCGRGANLNYHSERQQIQVGTQPIYETQVVGYRCSGCGEQK